MTTNYTSTIHLEKPDFRSPDWADKLNRNWDTIDAAIRNILTNVVPWENDTTYGVGQVVIDTVAIPISYWINNVEHSTPLGSEISYELRDDGGSELRDEGGRELREGGGTFLQERANFPLYWTPFSFGLQPRGAWTHDTVYFFNDIAYDSVLGITGICKLPHTSNHSGTIIDDAEDWDFIVNLPTVFTASATSYDNDLSGLASVNAQDAIDEINQKVTGAYVAGNVAYTNLGTGLVSTNVQTAISELKGLHDADAVLIAANSAAITAGLIGTGFPHWRPTSEVLVGWIIANGTTIGSGASVATQRANADCLPLYTWHYNNFSNTECPVSGGRGANAASDFAANKTITVLDMKGTGNVGADTMGGAASTRLNGVPVTSGSITTPGSVIGENTHTLTLGEIPTGITVANAAQAISVTNTGTNPYRGTSALNSQATFGGGPEAVFADVTSVANSAMTSTGNNAISATSNNTSGAAHNSRGRDRTGWWYLKL